MLIKNLSKIDVEDEFVRVVGSDTIRDVVQRLLPKHARKLTASPETFYTPLLAAFVEKEGKVAGYVDRDTILRALVEETCDWDTPVEQIMEAPVVMPATTAIREIVNLIIDKGFLAVGVVEDEKLAGVITVFDAIFLQRELDAEVDHAHDHAHDHVHGHAHDHVRGDHLDANSRNGE